MEIKEIIEKLETKRKERLNIIEESYQAIHKLRQETKTNIRDALIKQEENQITMSCGYIEAYNQAIRLLKEEYQN